MNSDLNEFFYLKCKIRSGGFSGEREFEIQLANNEPLIGMASVRYLRDSQKRALDENTPRPGSDDEIDGFLVCRVIDKDEESGNVTVEVPSSDLAFVSDQNLTPA